MLVVPGARNADCTAGRFVDFAFGVDLQGIRGKICRAFWVDLYGGFGRWAERRGAGGACLRWPLRAIAVAFGICSAFWVDLYLGLRGEALEARVCDGL
eukprot:3678484-Rhodomonas_salina.1